MEALGLIHPTAIIDRQVELAADVKIGPYVVIRGRVTIGAGSVVHEHSVIGGPTRIGGKCKIGPAAYLGLDPQHLRFVATEDSPTYLIIGDNVTVRESARLHRATEPGEEHATRIGNNCFLMGATHVAHDCVLEPDVIMADAALLGGHCHVGRNAFLGGGCTIHQFVRIGRLAIIAGNEALSQDVPPFAAVRYGRLKGYNAIGCKRSGMSRASIGSIRACFHELRRHGTLPSALAAVRETVPQMPEVNEWLEFVTSSHRGIMPSRVRNQPHGVAGDELS